MLLEAPGYSPRILCLREGHQSADRAREVKLLEGGSLRIAARRAGAAPLVGAQITIDTSSSNLLEDEDVRSVAIPRWQLITNEKGECSFDGLPASAELRIEMRIPGEIRRPPEPVVLAGGETATREIILGGGCELTGTALDQDGAPFQGKLWLVRAGRYESHIPKPRMFSSSDDSEVVADAAPDAEGHFRMTDIAEGQYWLGPTFGWHLAPDGVAPLGVPLAVGPNATNVNLTVYRGLFIEGKLLGPEGEPRTGWQVFASAEDPRLWVEGRSRKDGTFRIGPLPPGEFTIERDNSEEMEGFDPVKARAGDRNVVLQMRRFAITTIGVVNAEGTAVPASVVGTILGIPDGPRIQGRYNLRPMYEFHGLDPGNYVFVATTESGLVSKPKLVEVVSDAAGYAILVVEAGGKLSVTIDAGLDAGWVTISAVEDGTLVGHTAISMNEKPTAVITVPPGRVTLRGSSWGKSQRDDSMKRDLVPVTVDVKAGETVATTLKIR
jgi:hypothetical protein